MQLVIENVAPGGPAHTVIFDGRLYPVLGCKPQDGGMTEIYDLKDVDMTAEQAVKYAAEELARAEDAAAGGISDLAVAHVAVADGWNRLAATIKQNLIGP
jgi:hypothetical protein